MVNDYFENEKIEEVNKHILDGIGLKNCEDSIRTVIKSDKSSVSPKPQINGEYKTVIKIGTLICVINLSPVEVDENSQNIGANQSEE